MKNVRVHDRRGNFVNLVLFGDNAGSVEVIPGAEVAFYFLQAVRGLNNENGKLWAYDEACVVLINAKVPVPPSQTEIEIRI